MSSHNPHSSNWLPYRQNQGNNFPRDEYQGYGRSSGAQGRGMETQNQSTKHGTGMLSGNIRSPVQNKTSQGGGGGHYNAYSTDPPNSYHGASPDMQHMMHMMVHLRNQLDQLNQLIAQNNQLLQSMHHQEDTKCVQGSGGGAVIVRM
ncbi:hypothetical protein [Oceanobacillus jeddahense]|uniref:Spore coat protein n=1 Tax=Oceanobacillus jeddahense TaxID=1462527 RepID=A0ABY5JLG7_9BACI|nr:hypothetical protein [Oceanobacillus jeddahense]UUI01128.1 hypothetical protein NP439_13765 [Oceanobacillus jeddahense]